MPHDEAPELAASWDALKRAEWSAAKDSFAAYLDTHPDDPTALDGLGRALWWLGEYQDGIESRRQAYAQFRQRNDIRQAANLAIYLAAEHRISGEQGAANGWLARAQRLLADQEVGAEHGWLEIEQAKRAALRPSEKELHADAAARIARDLADPDLEAAALSQLGLAGIDAGDVTGGMALLDEAMAMAMGGEASDPLAIGDACCTTLVACDRLADFEHAADWCRVVVDFTGRRGYTPLHAWCRTIYAGVLIATGDWERADTELRLSLETYEELGSDARVFAIGRLAELRVRQGRLGEADTLLAGYQDHPLAITATVGLALARDDPALACALAMRRLEAAGDARAVLATLLPSCAEALIASGELERVKALIERMAALGHELGRENLVALARFHEARIAVSTGDRDAARALLEAARESFTRLRMPLEEGRARLELARIDEPDLALFHARAALAIFERLGALGHADECAAFLRGRGASGRSAPRISGDLTAREREVLDLLREGLSNQAIGQRLFISPKTAEHHVGRILGKLGVKSRAEAAAYAVRAAAAAARRGQAECSG